MPFNIHCDPFEGGDYDEAAAQTYTEELIARFADSPQGKALGEAGGWTGLMLDYGFGYLSATPATMDASEFEEIVFDIFPRKVSCDSEDASDIVRELRAFWTFVGREFALPNAAACLAVLDGSAERRLERELADPKNFGLAKSFFMSEKAEGFDMRSESGRATWTMTFNQRLSAAHR